MRLLLQVGHHEKVEVDLVPEGEVDRPAVVRLARPHWERLDGDVTRPPLLVGCLAAEVRRRHRICLLRMVPGHRGGHELVERLADLPPNRLRHLDRLVAGGGVDGLSLAPFVRRQLLGSGHRGDADYGDDCHDECAGRPRYSPPPPRRAEYRPHHVYETTEKFTTVLSGLCRLPTVALD